VLEEGKEKLSEVLLMSHLDKNLMKRGKVRDIYEEKDGSLVIVATDRISAFDRVLPEGIPRKGESINKLSTFWFKSSTSIFPNHFLKTEDERSMRVQKAKRIDVEWIVRKYLYGSAWRAYSAGARVISGVRLPSGLSLAEELPEQILTPTTKSETGHDQEITKEEAINKGLLSREDWGELEEASFRLYDYYSSHAKSCGIIIPDFKLEFGRTQEGLIQIDEPPTHDSARFWSKRDYKIGGKQEPHCLDKEFLREYLMRIGFTGEGEVPHLPSPIIDQVSLRCIGAYRVLSGQAQFNQIKLKSLEDVMKELG
jgi:phosphoribosylaminoimidazole-succinocarboxamide synthase